MPDKNNVIVAISARDRTKAGIAAVQSNLNRLKSHATSVFGVVRTVSIGAAAAIGAVSGAALLLSKRFADNAIEADRMSKALGISVRAWSGLTQVFKQAGLDGDDVRDVITNVSLSLKDAEAGSKDFQNAFRKLGIETKRFARLKVDKQFLAIADGIKAIEDPAERVAIAVRLFGEDVGSKLVGILAQGGDGISAFIDEAERLGGVLNEEQVAGVRLYEEAMLRLRIAFDGISATVGQTVLPILADLADRAIPFLRQGVELLVPALDWLGSTLLNVTQFFFDFLNNLGQTSYLDNLRFGIEQLVLAFQNLFGGNWQALWGNVQNVVNVVVSNIGALLDSLFRALPDVAKDGIGKVYLNILTGLNSIGLAFNQLAKGIEASIKLAFFAVLAPVQAILNVIIGGAQTVENTLAQLGQRDAVQFAGVDLIGKGKAIDFTSSIGDYQFLQPSAAVIGGVGKETAANFLTTLNAQSQRQGAFNTALQQANQRDFSGLGAQIPAALTLAGLSEDGVTGQDSFNNNPLRFGLESGIGAAGGAAAGAATGRTLAAIKNAGGLGAYLRGIPSGIAGAGKSFLSKIATGSLGALGSGALKLGAGVGVASALASLFFGTPTSAQGTGITNQQEIAELFRLYGQRGYSSATGFNTGNAGAYRGTGGTGTFRRSGGINPNIFSLLAGRTISPSFRQAAGTIPSTGFGANLQNFAPLPTFTGGGAGGGGGASRGSQLARYLRDLAGATPEQIEKAGAIISKFPIREIATFTDTVSRARGRISSTGLEAISTLFRTGGVTGDNLRAIFNTAGIYTRPRSAEENPFFDRQEISNARREAVRSGTPSTSSGGGSSSRSFGGGGVTNNYYSFSFPSFVGAIDDLVALINEAIVTGAIDLTPTAVEAAT